MGRSDDSEFSGRVEAAAADSLNTALRQRDTAIALLAEFRTALAESLEYIAECNRRGIVPEIGEGFREAEALLQRAAIK